MSVEDIVAWYARLPFPARKPSLLRLVALAERLRKGKRRERVAKLANGGTLEVDLELWLQRQLFYFGVFEPESTEIVRQHLRPGDTFVDVGANIGYYTILAGRLVGPAGRVIAFEPTTEFFDRLRKNVALNGLLNADLVKMVVSNDDMDRRVVVAGQTASINLYGEGPAETVASTTLDSYFDGWPGTVELMKIDVDGWDLQVLQGGMSFLANYRPQILVECINYGPSRPEAFFELLDGLGYSVSFDRDWRRPVSRGEFVDVTSVTKSTNLYCSMRQSELP